MNPIFTAYALPEFPGKVLLQKGASPAFGDSIHPTMEDARAEWERAIAREARAREWEAKERERREEMEAQAALDRDFDGWEATLSPLKLGKAVSVLCSPLALRSGLTTRKELIREYVRKGAQIEAIEGSPTLCLPDGSFYRASVFTATGLAYARFLISCR